MRDQYAPVADLVGRDSHKIDNECFGDRLEKADRSNELCRGLIEDQNQTHTAAFKRVRKPAPKGLWVEASVLAGLLGGIGQTGKAPVLEVRCQNLLFELFRVHAMEIRRVTENLRDNSATSLAVYCELDFNNAWPARGLDRNEICPIATE